jgi:hypothetical protein
VKKKNARRQHLAPNQTDASESYTAIEIKDVINTIVAFVKIIDTVTSTNTFV